MSVNTQQFIIFGAKISYKKYESICTADEDEELFFTKGSNLLAFPDNYSGEHVYVGKVLEKSDRDGTINDVNMSILQSVCNEDTDTVSDMYNIMGCYAKPQLLFFTHYT